MELKRVVVTGLGTINPLGNSLNEFWENLLKGKSGANMITRFNAEKFKSKFACEVKNWDASKYFDRKEIKRLDLFAQFALVAVSEAMADSQIDIDNINVDKAGVIWGSGIGGLGTFLHEIEAFTEGDYTPRFSPFFIPKMIADIASGHISMKYHFRGPNYTTVSACASSTNALIDSFNYIRLGKANLFITGGSEATINEAGVGGFNSMQALSTNNDEYLSASRPFDVSRDGFIMGEGSGALIFEELEHAKKRGAKIYAEVAGGGMSADAHHLTAPHPEGLGAINVMNAALEDANLKPEDIDYVNVHGTSTPLGDLSEIKAIVKVFGEHAYKLNISSTKSMTGHLLGSAGAVEAIASLLATRENICPPTINCKNLDPQLDQKLNYTLDKAQKKTIRAALSNTFGFGGHNASIIFKKFAE